MSEATAIAMMLSEDSEIIAVVGEEARIQLGTLSEKPPHAPPLILITTEEGIPAIEGEDGPLAEKTLCTIGLVTDTDRDSLTARIRHLMEANDYRLEKRCNLQGPRREWHCEELYFSTTRLR